MPQKCTYQIHLPCRHIPTLDKSVTSLFEKEGGGAGAEEGRNKIKRKELSNGNVSARFIPIIMSIISIISIIIITRPVSVIHDPILMSVRPTVIASFLHAAHSPTSTPCHSTITSSRPISGKTSIPSFHPPPSCSLPHAFLHSRTPSHPASSSSPQCPLPC